MNNLDDTQPTKPPGFENASLNTRPNLLQNQSEHLDDQLSKYQPIRIALTKSASHYKSRPGPKRGLGCFIFILGLLILLITYLIFPIRTNIILLGIDDRAPGGVLGRSDTLILLTLKPVDRYVGMLSIPRDLWVNIPGVGENRINTAHFFAEAANSGSGPGAVKNVIKVNFGVEPQYYLRTNFANFKQIINASGGVQITLLEPMGGYPVGTHLLDANQALAFVRDRTSGGDDFARMRQTQVFVDGLIQTILSPANISRWPVIFSMALNTIETDIPVFLWPRLMIASILAFPDGFQGRVIDREMVNPFTTNAGAQVLAPNWDMIRPVVLEMFGN